MVAQGVERKYLVRSCWQEWKRHAAGVGIRQGYLTVQKQLRSVRVRVLGNAGFIVVEAASRGGFRRKWEYPIAKADAAEILDAAAIPPLIEKVRYEVPFGGLMWCVDEFGGDNAGLVLAEVEFCGGVERPEAWQPPLKPQWAGQDVTGRTRYLDNRLTELPYKDWPVEHRTLPDGTLSASRMGEAN